MEIKGIGINAHPARIDGKVEELEKELKFFQEIGYDYVEIPVDVIDVVYCGKLLPRRMNDLKALLSDFDLKYTVHAPLALDLRDQENLALQKMLFEASLDFTHEIGAKVFVYHYGQKTRNLYLEEALYQGILEMADYAAERGIQICVENIEIDPVQNVIEFVKEVRRKKGNVGMTFDFGHGYLAAKYFGFDFLESVNSAKPYICHIHLSDNFGRFEEMRLVSYEQYKLLPYRKLLALGKGDLHLPPGWGEVPLEAAFKLLDDYEGVLILEYYHHRYRPEAREILKSVKALVERHGHLLKRK